MHYVHASSDVLTAVQMKIQVFWDIMPRELLNRQLSTGQHFTLESCIIATLMINSCVINCLPVDLVEGTSCYTADNSPVGSA
jgi:hypothetical protein